MVLKIIKLWSALFTFYLNNIDIINIIEIDGTIINIIEIIIHLCTTRRQYYICSRYIALQHN